ncbi:hypothetical protein MHL86_00165 [Brevibacillus laterosporus]|uniref:hypothetical protein n=1 Tax=Brevibacillus laterosporus TaxID=1465 RepID=UPI00039FCFA6|nr:hypothetical protein [Brevibacillus laterosporus]
MDRLAISCFTSATSINAILSTPLKLIFLLFIVSEIKTGANFLGFVEDEFLSIS